MNYYFYVMSEQNMSYDSVDLGNHLIALCHKHGDPIKKTQLQKLLYLCYGYFLSNFNRVISTESPKAWPYGPVFPRTLKKCDFNNQILDNSIEKDEELNDVLKRVAVNYSHLSASALVRWSHKEDGPWYKAINSDGFRMNNPMDNNEIQRYFVDIDIRK